MNEKGPTDTSTLTDLRFESKDHIQTGAHRLGDNGRRWLPRYHETGRNLLVQSQTRVDRGQ
jgi:hypothetical protein